MTIEIECRLSGRILFSHEAEDNTTRLTLEAAVFADANLTGAYLVSANLADANLADANLAGANLADANLADANLADANLAGANLVSANLANANLVGAYLVGANLADANLADANLAGANLTGTYLAGANLTGANLAGEILTKAPICIRNLTWPVLITEGFMRIGCQRHSHEEWKSFDDDAIGRMERRAIDFWAQWKSPLLTVCDKHAATK